MPAFVSIVLGAWLAVSVAFMLAAAVASRRAGRRRPVCPVVDLQDVAIERARHRAGSLTRGQKGGPDA